MCPFPVASRWCLPPDPHACTRRAAAISRPQLVFGEAGFTTSIRGRLLETFALAFGGLVVSLVYANMTHIVSQVRVPLLSLTRTSSGWCVRLILPTLTRPSG